MVLAYTFCHWPYDKQAVGGRPPQYAPPLNSLCAGAEALRAAEQTAAPADGNVAAISHGEYFPTLTAAAA